MFKQLKKARGDEGFTLIELLIVIVILGILAAIVIFAVGGITDKGNKSACKADLKTVEVASEAYRAQNGAYAASVAAMIPNFLREAPTTSNGYSITYNSTTGGVTGDLDGGAATNDCSA
jgi:general secretion pathway protein G